jgi:site-specific DNA recombinase
MRIAIYARVSTLLQELEKTIESQLIELEPLIKEHNHIVIDKYIDDGYSGAMLARPELDRLRDDASKGLFEAVLAYDPDRLARKYAYQVLVIEELKSKGIECIFKEMKIVTTPEDQLLLDVRGVVAEYERAKILERTRRGRLHRAKSNHIIGNIPPYGYSCVSKLLSATGFAYYKINEREAKNVRLIFDFLANKHMTTYGIIVELNRMGIKPRKGIRWARSTINKIARNETYIGTTYYNKHYGVPAKNQTGINGEVKYHRRKNSSTRLRAKEEWIAISDIPAILDRDTFLRAQKQLDDNFMLADRNTKFQYLLKGLLKCGIDRKSIYGIPVHGRQYYRCSNKSKLNSDTGCSTPTTSAGILDPLVWNSVKELLDNPTLILEQYRKRQMYKNREIFGAENKLKQIEANILKLKNEENRILLAYSQEAISLDQYKAQNLRISNERKGLEEDIVKLKQLASNRQYDSNLSKVNIKRILKGFRQTLEGLDFDKKRTILRGVLNEIELKDSKVYIRGYLPLSPNVILRTQPPPKRAARCW